MPRDDGQQQQQQPDAPPANGPAVDEAALGKLIEDKVTAAFHAALASRPADSPPAAPAGGGSSQPAPPAQGGDSGGAGGIAAAIDSAVRSALNERDREDALVVLGREIDDLKAQVSRGGSERRRGWGAFLLGPGFSR